eukprot:gb/GECG01015212.1/.p1 GENE.gb/GECG01015212.1/~~gb/GECG01015212.1/.p1  ORF type:complete len:646 (+),score=59.14 gb/GECG01015212.1/:1-1938(+)
MADSSDATGYTRPTSADGTGHNEQDTMTETLLRQSALSKRFKDTLDQLSAARNTVNVPYWVTLVNETGIPVFSDSNYTTLSTENSVHHHLKQASPSPRSDSTPSTPSGGRNRGSQLMLTGLLTNLFKSLDTNEGIILDTFSTDNAIVCYNELRTGDLKDATEISEEDGNSRQGLFVMVVGKQAFEPCPREMALRALRYVKSLLTIYAGPAAVEQVLRNPNNKKLRSALQPARSRVRHTIEELAYSMVEPGIVHGISHLNSGSLAPFCGELATALRCRYVMLLNGPKIICANPAFWQELQNFSFEIAERAFCTDLQANAWADPTSGDQAANYPFASTFQLKLPDPESAFSYLDAYALVTSISFHLSSAQGRQNQLRLNAGMHPSGTKAVAVSDDDDTQSGVPERVRRIHVALSRRSAKDRSWLETMVNLMSSPDASNRPSLANQPASAMHWRSFSDELQSAIRNTNQPTPKKCGVVKELHKLSARLPERSASTARRVVCIVFRRYFPKSDLQGCQWVFWDPSFTQEDQKIQVELLLQGAIRESEVITGESLGFTTKEFSFCCARVKSAADSIVNIGIACSPAVGWVNQFHSLTRELARHFESASSRTTEPMDALLPAVTKLRLAATGFTAILGRRSQLQDGEEEDD